MVNNHGWTKTTDHAGENGTRRRMVLFATAFVGIVLTAGIAFGVLETVRQAKYAEVQGRVADLVGRVETETRVQMASLEALHAFMDVYELVSAGDFAQFAANLHASGVGTIAYGWAPRIGERNEPGDEGNILYPVEVLVPSGRVERLLGQDLRELAPVRNALQGSIESNDVRVSAPLSLGNDGGGLALAILPRYAHDPENDQHEVRSRDVDGIVFAVLDLQSMIGNVVSASSLAQLVNAGYLGIEVINQGSAGVSVPLFITGNFNRLAAPGQDNLLHRILISERHLKVAQRDVKIRVAIDIAALSNAPYLAASSILAIGLVLTLLVSAFIGAQLSYERRVNAMVRERTKALERSEQRLRDLADVSADWFWEMDSELRFTSLSGRFEDVTGLQRDTFLGRTREDAAGVRNHETDDNWRAHLDDMRNHRPFHDFRYVMPNSEKNDEYLSISGKPIFDDDGVFEGYRGTGRDVTSEEAAQRRLRESEARLHRNVEQLERSRHDLEESTRQMAELAERYAIEKDRAEASEHSKSEFLASMSHEIRTPMTGVMGFADMLLDSSLAPEDREKVIKIKGATQSLLTIINDILDLSKLDAGRLSIENLDFNLRTTVEEVLDLVRERARFKKLALNVDFQDGMDIGMHGDPTRFRQVLINLVGNAVKFTHAGSVSIKASVRGNDADQVVEFRVVDTGIGISEENTRRLFSDFSQADASISRHYEGTGLGLSISKRLVELMGGEIWVESEEGKGSAFCFTLPFRKATNDVTNAARHHVAEHYKTTRSLHILVAEDNKLNQRIIVATLDKFGHQATVVEDGEQAVSQVDKGDYDLILMDIRMPEMSGPDATRIIRARHDELANIPIVALTADAMEEHIRGYVAAGMNACVTKPIDRSQLVLTINEVLGEDVHVPLSEAEVARTGYALPTEDDADGDPSGEQAEVISVADFLSQLEGVADEIERNKGTKP